MSQVIPAADVIAATRGNKWRSWNRAESSGERSVFAEDACNRIFDGYAVVEPNYQGERFRRDAPVFAMGSCFAREIELRLKKMGGNVISVDETIERPEFRDESGRTRVGFFHRFTPRSMLQEFQASFGELPGWDDDALMFKSNRGVIDLNYWPVRGPPQSIEATLTRREIAGALVRKASQAEVIILTLGLIEAWHHKPTGFVANHTHPTLLAKNNKDFELHLIDVDEAVECLHGIDKLLGRHCVNPYKIIVTVSPVPMTATFTENDVIIANTQSKATLRAAALKFVDSCERAHYFPSYEMVTYSEQGLAWRPDRVHVNSQMVLHIVRTFLTSFYEQGAFGKKKAA